MQKSKLQIKMQKFAAAVPGILFIVLISLAVCPAYGQPPSTAQIQAEGPQTPLTVESWLINKPDEIVAVMSNGLRVAIKENHSNKVVAVRLYVAAGSIYEGSHLGAGLSHVFEHLLHGAATANRTEKESQLLLEEIGAVSNAYTTLDHTCYHLAVTSEHMDTAVELLADWITAPIISPDSVARELGVVQRELEKDKDEPDRVLYNLAAENRYGQHPAAYPVIGYQPLVAALTRDDLLNYYHQRYVPNNVVVSIVGDIDARSALATVARQFAGFERRSIPPAVLPADTPISSPHTRTRYMDIPHVLINMAWPTVELTHPDLYALDTLDYILTRGESSRLAKRLKNDKSLVLSINSYSSTPAMYPGSFVIQARIEPAKLAKARQAIIDELEQLKANGVSKKELATAKRQKIADHISSLQTMQGQADQIGRDLLATGDAHFSDGYVDRIQEVTPEQILEVARKYLDPQKLCLTQLLPNSLGPDAAGAVTTVKVLQDSSSMFTLPNGLRVILRPNHTVPLVSMQIYFRGGLLAENARNNGVGLFTAQASLKGTKRFSADEIAEFFDSRGGTISATSGNNTLFYTAQVRSDDFPKALDVFAQVACHPRFTAMEMEKLRPQLIGDVAALNENWHSEMQLFFRNEFFSKSPYKLLSDGSLDVLKTLKPEDLAAHHRKLAVGGNGVLAVFGDFDPDQAGELISRAFGSLPDGAKMTIPYIKPESFQSNRLAIKQTTKKVATVTIAFPGTVLTETEDRMALKVLDTIISGYRLPSGWLHAELRGKQLVYVVHAYEFSGLAPGYFAAFAACEPDKVNDVIEALERNLAKAAAGKFTEEELARAKGIIIAAEIIDRQTNADLASIAALDELYGLGYEHWQSLAERINAVTMAELKRVATKYLSQPHLVCVTTSKPELVKYPPSE
ncbi:MAG: hypothetical protein GWP14_08070 [Actinobacteria bacterium]|nr:hypothetical protein [Actinomycetota bacterium]